jgi:hypothetical protein
MDKRLLLASLAALAVMLGFDLLIMLSSRPLDLPIASALGTVPLGGLLVTLLAMALGGWIAGRGFRRIAVLLATVIWLSVVIVIQLASVGRDPSAAISMGELLEHNALAMVLSLAVAWGGAVLGERVRTANRAVGAT